MNFLSISHPNTHEPFLLDIIYKYVQSLILRFLPFSVKYKATTPWCQPTYTEYVYMNMKFSHLYIYLVLSERIIYVYIVILISLYIKSYKLNNLILTMYTCVVYVCVFLLLMYCFFGNSQTPKRKKGFHGISRQ